MVHFLFNNKNLRVCWNWQTGTFEGRVSLAYGFKSRLEQIKKQFEDDTCVSKSDKVGCLSGLKRMS